MSADAKTAVVIGSGFGGLAAACRLQAAGVQLNATWGNVFTIEPKFTQTAWFRPQNRSEDVEGLYLVGGGTHPGAGVPGVLLSAETTYGCIAEDLGLPDQWDWDEPGRVDLAEEAVFNPAEEAGAGKSR